MGLQVIQNFGWFQFGLVMTAVSFMYKFKESKDAEQILFVVQ